MQNLLLLQEEDVKKWIKEAVHEEVRAVIIELHHEKHKTKESFLTRKEIATALRISLVTLHEWMKRGLPKHSGKAKSAKRGRTLFLHSEVMEWLKQNRA